MDKAVLRDLLERVEKATGPDRTTDAILTEAFDLPECHKPDCLPDVLRRIIGRVKDGSCPGDTDVPPYTASIDAALALVERVLPGAFWLTGKGKTTAMEKMFACQLLFGTNEIIGEGEAETAPLAILAALLNALLAEEGR